MNFIIVVTITLVSKKQLFFLESAPETTATLELIVILN